MVILLPLRLGPDTTDGAVLLPLGVETKGCRELGVELMMLLMTHKNLLVLVLSTTTRDETMDVEP